MRYKAEKKFLVQQMCQYIEEHLCEELTYTHFLETFGLRRYDLITTFKEEKGMTLTAYIIQRRLYHTICKVQGGMSLEKATLTSGFNTYSHFYKEFVKHYGTSPRVYFSDEKRLEREEK